MAVFSPTNAKVHFKAYDGNFTDALGNTAITQNNGVAMATAQKLFGQQAMFMANFSDSITFNTPSVFDVQTGDYTVGFWFHPTQFTSYDRLFATGPDSGGNPLRIYNHNGSIQVYVEDDDESPGDAAHDLLFSYYLGASATNQWWHIMVQRNSGTTKLYINGTEQRSSTVSYEINNSSSPTLGADINAAATGVKGYIQDFFWTEEAVSFSQADFDPSTPEPVTFHSGNPSISSFSSSANSVENSGDTVTLSWSVSGETKLELLKYVGGLLNSTEDVLGLSSKSVTITETVSYKIRATNDNSAVDSSSVQITLGGGNSMAGTMLSGSDAIPYQLHAGVLGGFVSGSSAGQFQAIPVEGLTAVSADRVAGRALHSSFVNSSGSIIAALNFLQSEGDFQVGSGVDSAALGFDIIQVSASHQSFQFADGAGGRLELSGNVAGDGLALAAGSLSVKVDDSSIETNSDTLRVKAGGIAHAMLANDAVDGDNIADDAVNSEHIALGALDAEHYATGSIENGHLAGSIANAKLANSAVTVTAGDGLSGGGSVALGSSVSLAVGVDDSSIETNSDVLRVKAGGVTNAMLAGSIANAKLANSAITISGDDFGGTGAVSLGGTATLSIAASRVGATEIIAKGVGTAEIQDNAVNGAKLLDATVSSDKLALSIHRTAACENMVFDANGTANTGLYFLGTDSSGNTARFQVVVQGGMLQLKTGMAQPSESGTTSAVAGGADAT